MKNMRKIVAVLAAVLMLCSVLPLGALSVAAYSADFEDGTVKGWQSDCGVEVVDLDGSKVLKWDASPLAWANMYNYCNLSANTDYVVTMKVKADRDTDMNFKVLKGDWGATDILETFGVSTEWQEITLQFNSGEGSFVMLSSNADIGAGATYYVDDFSIEVYVAPAVPGVIINGDFETGDFNGWAHHQSTAISTDAHSGSYAANIKGDGGWGGMLNQEVPVKAGTSYEISLWAKANANGANIQIQDGPTGTKTNLNSTWFTKTEWTNIIWEVTPTTDVMCINFCGGGNGIAEDVLVDDITVTEIKQPSYDGYIYNGDFETGKTDHWTNLWGSSSIELVEGRDGGYAIKGTASGSYNITYQEVAVTPNTNYTIWAFSKDSNSSALWIKNAGGNGDLKTAGFNSSSEWALTTVSFNSGANESIWVGLMGITAGGTYTVDDIFMFEAKEASNDGYIVNGDFETGALSPWNNLWGSCPKAEIIKGGKDDTFALQIVSGQWKHVRQLPIAVEPNTDYTVSVWSKNTKDVTLLIKGLQDDASTETADIKNFGLNAGDEWTQFTNTFNSGDHNWIIVSFMGNADDCYGTFDNIVMEKVEAGCAHEYDNDCDEYCNICDEWRVANHSLTYVEAVIPANCMETGHEEYWVCENCNAYFGDAEGSWQVNPAWITTTGEHVRPEGVAPCAVVACELCGEDSYGEACTRPEDAPACQNALCVYCGEVVFGEGHSYGYDEETWEPLSPLCQPGDCIYCGEHLDYIYECENGSYASCSVDGECIYGCGKQYPATGIHAVDNPCEGGMCWMCWTEIPAADHVYDDDADATCNVCGAEREVASDIIYGDADGNGVVDVDDVILLQQYVAEWEVELNATTADADGNGVVDVDDVILLQQYVAEWEVVLGPQG